MNFTFTKSIFLLIFLSLTTLGVAQKRIHVLEILDTDMVSSDATHPAELRNGAENTRFQIKIEAEFLMKYLKLTESDVKYYEVSGKDKDGKDNFTKAGVATAINSLVSNCHPGDYVLIANYTHGLRSDRNNTDAPQISLGPNYAHEYYYFDDILVEIEKAKPAFILSLVTACQKNIRDLAITDNPLRVPVQPRVNRERVAPNENREESAYQYQRLFENPIFQNYSTVSVELYSCSKNAFSYVDSHGGTFAHEFFKIFKQKLSLGGRAEISWKNIAFAVKTNVVQLTTNNEDGKQTPVGIIRYIGGDGQIKKEYLDESVRKEVIPLENQDIYIEYTNLKKNPSFRLAIRFVVLAISYMEEAYPELSLKTLDIAIPALEKQMFRNNKAKVVIPKNVITDAGDVVYFLGKAYEFKGRILAETNPEEAKKCFEIAKEQFERIGAKSSDAVMKRRLDELKRFKVIRP
jgi:hypothetical protein